MRVTPIFPALTSLRIAAGMDEERIQFSSDSVEKRLNAPRGNAYAGELPTPGNRGIFPDRFSVRIKRFIKPNESINNSYIRCQ